MESFPVSMADDFQNRSWKSDIIFDTLTQAIHEYQLTSFDAFGINVTVYPTNDSRPVFDTNRSWLGFNRYVFEVFGKPGKQMNVRIDNKGSIRIWLHGHWARLGTFLKHVKPSIDYNDRNAFPQMDFQRLRWQQQSRWWVANGMIFRLLDLPSEIREIVYGHAIGEKIEPYPTSRARRLGFNTRFILDRKANSNLLKTCRLVYEEASNILFAHTPFFIEHFGVAKSVFANPTQRSRIRRIELALSHDDFLRFFGGKPDEDGGIWSPSSAAKALRSMKLSRLQIMIAPPSLVTASDWLDGACQKIVVDWIFECAWQFVRGHPVKVTGFVKKSQQQAFEVACCVEKLHFEIWQRQRVAASGDEGSLAEYDECMDEVDEEGGFTLEESPQADEDDVFKPRQVMITESRPICLCNPSCTSESWDAGV